MFYLFRFICVDVDKPHNPEWQAQEFVGQFDCDLGSIGKYTFIFF